MPQDANSRDQIGAGYQVMVAGKATDITTLDRDALIEQLTIHIDWLESMDELSASLSTTVSQWRRGQRAAAMTDAE